MMVYICTTTPSLNFKNLYFMHFLLSVAMIFISARKFHCIQARDEDDFIVDYIMTDMPLVLILFFKVPLSITWKSWSRPQFTPPISR